MGQIFVQHHTYIINIMCLELLRDYELETSFSHHFPDHETE